MEKIKQFIQNDDGKDILTIFIIILVGLLSFGLGRLSKENSDTGVKIEYKSQSNQQASASIPIDNFYQNSNYVSNVSNNSVGKAFFASNRGKKYYSIGCSAGKTIKQENRIYFNTSDEAIKAGYEKSASCN